MRSVLCFGDSNTWGHIPGTQGGRLGPNERWPGVMGRQLGPNWHVIEEGLSGRTTVHDDPIEGKEKNGRRFLRTCLHSHQPLDLIIVMLGTNDIKIRFNQTAPEIAMGIGALIQDIKEIRPGLDGRIPEILIVSPAPILADVGPWTDILDGGREKSLRLADEYERMALHHEVHFFDAGSVVTCSTLDGTHLDGEAHDLLGKAMADMIESIGWL